MDKPNIPIKLFFIFLILFYLENKTDSTGFFQMALPGKGTGDWKLVISGEGHEEAAHFSIRDEGQTTAAAAIAALFILPAAWIWRRRGER